MLQTLLDALTREQRAELHEKWGMSTQTITNLKAGVRSGGQLPTQNQVVALAAVTGVDRHALQDEVAQLREKDPARKEMLKRALGKARGAVVMLTFGVIAAVAGAALGYSFGGSPGRFSRR